MLNGFLQMNAHWKQMYVALKNISEKSTMYA